MMQQPEAPLSNMMEVSGLRDVSQQLWGASLGGGGRERARLFPRATCRADSGHSCHRIWRPDRWELWTPFALCKQNNRAAPRWSKGNGDRSSSYLSRLTASARRTCWTESDGHSRDRREALPSATRSTTTFGVRRLQCLFQLVSAPTGDSCFTTCDRLQSPAHGAGFILSA
jgi:hypothetical protein